MVWPGTWLGGWVYDSVHARTEAEAALLLRKPAKFAKDLRDMGKAVGFASKHAQNPEMKLQLAKASAAILDVSGQINEGVNLVASVKRIERIIRAWNAIDTQNIIYNPEGSAGNFQTLFVEVGAFVKSSKLPMGDALGSILMECGKLIVETARKLNPANTTHGRASDSFTQSEIEKYGD